jgi:hypothetical protein
MNNTNPTTIIIDTKKLAGKNPSIEFLPIPIPPAPVEAPFEALYDWPAP